MKRALLVIDVQNEYISGKLKVTYPADSLVKITKAIGYAKDENILVIIVQHTALDEAQQVFVKGSYEWELHNEIKKVRPDFYIEKNFPSAFVNTSLENYLRENGIETVVICGYVTQICCDTTARYAKHLGFNVEFLCDATATLGLQTPRVNIDDKTLFNAAIATQSAMFSNVMKVEEWMQIL